MNFDDVLDFSVGLGEAIVSVGEDIALGVQRSAQGLGASGSARQSQIGSENERTAKILYKALTTAPSAATHPLTLTVTHIMTKYYDVLPDEMLRALAKKAGVVAATTAANMAVRKQTKAYLIKKVVPKIASKIASSAAYRALAKRLGVSAGASASGVGTLVGLLMAQGLIQRASISSRRLAIVAPDLHRTLKRDGLDMLFFLVEKPMEKQMKAIAAARANGAAFKKAAEEAAQKAR